MYNNTRAKSALPVAAIRFIAFKASSKFANGVLAADERKALFCITILSVC
jgi:hypothetical protein